MEHLEAVHTLLSKLQILKAEQIQLREIERGFPFELQAKDNSEVLQSVCENVA
ncbi:MAG: hypothetical protein F6K24_51620 [Okeania sp. SIO2D1]|nr:hypothetical protein [Okeania sp. SIO2D1]